MNKLLFLLVILTPVILSLSVTETEATNITASPTDLYRVNIGNKSEARTLRLSGTTPILRLQDGYLVLAAESGVEYLRHNNLDFQLIEKDIRKSEIALDMSLDGRNVGRYPLLFETGELRLYRVDWQVVSAEKAYTGLAPLPFNRVPVTYRAHRPPAAPSADMVDLNWLISTISRDTLESCMDILQAFGGRRAGTSEYYAGAAWARNKFIQLGYDSVYYDTHWDSVYGEWAELKNVVAYKPGTVYPEFHVVVGAHLDAVPNSPGADDNGSGSAAVLELARILKDIETSVSFVFALFDGEEEGLLGSASMAARMYQAGTRLVFMYNMDMIGHYENDFDAYIYATNPYHYDTWGVLADSLDGINLSPHVRGAGGSDHMSFEQVGYESVMLHEYIFSSVYHSYRDSTTYIDYDYMTRMVQSSIAMVYYMSETFAPEPSVEIEPAGPLALALPPAGTDQIEVRLREYSGAAVIPDGVVLHYSINDNPWTETIMSPTGNDTYAYSFTSLVCGDKIDYYITAEDAALGLFYYPNENNSIMACGATGYETVIDEGFASDPGWETSGDAGYGHWEWGQPNYNDPYGAAATSDFDGNLYCYLTDPAIGIDVDNGHAVLTSPVFDGDGSQVIVQYAHWFSNHAGAAPYSDVMTTDVSSNGGQTWNQLEQIGPVDQASGGWFVSQFWLNDVITTTDQMRLRFTASDTGDDSRVEAGLDAVSVIRFTFYPIIVTESMPTWTAGAVFSRSLEAQACSDSLTWSDKYGHLEGSGLIVTPPGTVEGVPSSEGNIMFVASAMDELGREDERIYSFRINPALNIATTELSPAGVDSDYNFTLAATGGTGVLTWTDQNNDLEGTGLNFSPDGLLSGIPTDTGTIVFTAIVEDEVGAQDERPYSLTVMLSSVCGDANADKQVNVGDAVFLINYVFKSGPAPQPVCIGDANDDSETNVGDAVYLINYVFQGGPEPVDNCCR